MSVYVLIIIFSPLSIIETSCGSDGVRPFNRERNLGIRSSQATQLVNVATGV